MKKVMFRGRLVLLLLGALLVSASLMGLQPKLHSGTPAPPDIVPYGLGDWFVSARLGGPTLEFEVLTANIGGTDWVRPRDPQDPRLPPSGRWLLRQIYEYALYQLRDGEYVQVNVTRKDTICVQDDEDRGRAFPCMQRHAPRFDCGLTLGRQGVSVGWADSYFRRLRGQWIGIQEQGGRFLPSPDYPSEQFILQVRLDPDGDLQRDDIPPESQDSDPTNNFADFYFTWNGQSGTIGPVEYYFDTNICPSANE